MYRRQPSAALPLSTRAVAASEPDVLVTHLAIRRASDYDRIGRPVVHDGLELDKLFRHPFSLTNTTPRAALMHSSRTPAPLFRPLHRNSSCAVPVFGKVAVSGMFLIKKINHRI